MTPIAPHVTVFLCERLPIQCGASEHTSDAYAHALRLFFLFASSRLGVPPCELVLEQLDAAMVMAFLDHLQAVRKNTASTRNARLVAIKSFMRFLEYRVPSILEQSRRIHAIPAKKRDTRLVNHLDIKEVKAILDSPDLSTRTGIRDRAMIHLCFAAGLRVTELVTLPMCALMLHPRPSIRVVGKGRRERTLPLWKNTAADLRAWLGVRGDLPGIEELFVNARNTPMVRAGFEYILRKHVCRAADACASLKGKQVSPHVLRHTCAMTILQATGDLRRVSLWLGHADMQTSQVYVRADPAEKLDILERTAPLQLRRGKFRPPDTLIAALQRP
jgi:integrase/recombinase XerD